MVKIDQRLKLIAELVPPTTINLADVGTDHAYLPIYLVQTGRAQHVYATDIKKGPLFNAQSHISRFNLQNKIETRLGAGLKPLFGLSTIDTLVISGMGGKLISEIMQDYRQLPSEICYIFAPNSSEDQLRKWLAEHNFLIVTEKIMEEQHHIYEFIVARYQLAPVSYSPADLLLGPILRQERNLIFQKKWRQVIAKLEVIKAQRQKAKQTVSVIDLEKKIKMIEDNL